MEVPAWLPRAAAQRPDHPAVESPEGVHTSGTAGRPRAVALTYGNWLASAQGSAVAMGHEPQERWLCALPLAHVGGLSILTRSVIHATTAVVHPRFEVAAVGEALAGGQ